jgi:peptide/nickel transport system substrate-binding protein
VGVAGGNISLGMQEAPTGCNPHTPAGDSTGTRLVLSGVLPSPYIVDSDGSLTQNSNLISQAELVSTKPETIVYTLSPHAIWADGVPITAADFIYAWQQQRGEPDTVPGTVASIQGYKDIASVTGSNKGRIVTVIFHTPYADWQRLFNDLMPAHVMEKSGWDPSCTTVDPSVDVSAGPFAITAISSQSITLSDNPKWWGVKANAQAITIHYASSTNQLAQWMRSGYVQAALPENTTQSFLTEMASLPSVDTNVAISSTFLQLEMASGPDTTLSPDMRFAIALMINRQDLLNTEAGWALPTAQVADSHIWVQGQNGYKGTTVTPDTGAPSTTSSTPTTLIGQGGSVNFPVTPVPAQADALMIASGYERTGDNLWHSDFGVPLTLHIVVDEGDPFAKSTAPLIAAQLEAGGFDVTLYPASSATMAGTILANGFANMALVPRTSSPFLSQALSWYTLGLGIAGANGSQDWSGFDDDAVTDLLTTASQQLNANTAAADYQEADQDLWDEMVALPLFPEPSTLVWSRTLGGVEATPKSDSLLWYAQLWAVRKPESTSSTTPSLPGQ